VIAFDRLSKLALETSMKMGSSREIAELR
jgi:hypothetical protein